MIKHEQLIVLDLCILAPDKYYKRPVNTHDEILLDAWACILAPDKYCEKTGNIHDEIYQTAKAICKNLEYKGPVCIEEHYKDLYKKITGWDINGDLSALLPVHSDIPCIAYSHIHLIASLLYIEWKKPGVPRPEPFYFKGIRNLTDTIEDMYRDLNDCIYALSMDLIKRRKPHILPLILIALADGYKKDKDVRSKDVWLSICEEGENILDDFLNSPPEEQAKDYDRYYKIASVANFAVPA